MTYLPRYVDTLLDELLSELPAVMIMGPRACGKTTTAIRRARSVVRLDTVQQASVFAAAPDEYLRAQEPPVLIDEWQEVPESIGAVKRAVDAGAGAGSYLVTGSVRARRTGSTWPGTGRVIPVHMYGLTRGEIERTEGAITFLDRIFDDDPEFATLRDAPTVAEYIEQALEGGFPEAIALSPRRREDWFAGYIEQLVHRDVADLADIRLPPRMSALLQAVALNTAGLPSAASLQEAAGIDARTTRAYLDVLEDLRIIERLPAWHTNRVSRLVKAPKFHVVDTGLGAHTAGLDAPALLADGNALGRVVDSFVTSQIRPLLSIGRQTFTAHHLRDANGDHEVDLVLESRSGEIIAIEVKASNTVRARDARHLAWLRDRLGDSFRRGVVFHTGDTIFPLGDRIWALPIAAIWH